MHQIGLGARPPRDHSQVREVGWPRGIANLRAPRLAKEIFSCQRSAPKRTRRMSLGTLRLSEAFVVVRSSVLELRTVFHPRRGPFGSAAPIGLYFRRNARWGYAGVTGTPRAATRPDLLPEAPPATLRRSAAL